VNKEEVYTILTIVISIVAIFQTWKQMQLNTKEVLFEKGDKYYKILRNVLLNSTSKGMVIRRLYKYDELELRAIERDYSLIDNSISWNCVAWVERRFLEEV